MIDLVELSGGAVRPESIDVIGTKVFMPCISDWFDSAASRWLSFIYQDSDFRWSSDPSWRLGVLLESLPFVTEFLNYPYLAEDFFKAIEIKQNSFRDFAVPLRDELILSFTEILNKIKDANNQDLSDDEMKFIESDNYFWYCVFDYVHSYSLDRYKTVGEDQFVHFLFFATGISPICSCKMIDGYSKKATFDSIEKFMSAPPWKEQEFEVLSVTEVELYRDSIDYFSEAHPEFEGSQI